MVSLISLQFVSEWCMMNLHRIIISSNSKIDRQTDRQTDIVNVNTYANTLITITQALMKSTDDSCKLFSYAMM